jgi:N-acetylneuraminate synthase
MSSIKVGDKTIGDGHPVFVVAEIGINHNGSLEIAKQLIDVASMAGCDAVKFQKRTPEICVPEAERSKLRDTPWGRISYMAYRQRVEFGRKEYEELDRYCRQKSISWLASCWDVPSVDFIERLDPPCYKVASASLTDHPLVRKMVATGKPVILSTGMSTLAQIDAAVALIPPAQRILTHATSTYPCKPEELNLRVIGSLRERYDCPVGYSGHEVGLQTTCAAVALGACLVERHITLDRAMWGSDQAASVEPWGFMRLVRDIRVIRTALGDGVKRVYASESGPMAKLRLAEEPADADTP